MINDLDETVRQNPCLGCPGLCCSQNLVNVCGYDVWTIARELHIEPTSFLAFAEFGEESPYCVKVDRSEKAYCPALYMRELPDGSRRCLFALDLPNDKIRCGIYPFRPIGCQAYPFAFAGEEVGVKPWALCAEGAWNRGKVDIAYWERELGRHDMEFSIYAFIIATWNKEITKQPDSGKLDFRPFLKYLMSVYRNLDLVRETVPPGAWPEIWKRWHQFTAKGLNPLVLKRNDTMGLASWTWWLQNIHEKVAEANQNIQLHTTSLEKSPEGILP